ncbi:MAG TPA: nucleoside triphosphate pyrophosphohydrolase, partial [Gemmatimonadetes bacterium]|nr:nucleoside triphosphate pyrophosphohydrolase [Gemmatimonadota bacterium]
MNPTNQAHHFPGPGTLDRALNLVRFLRCECPWDAQQTAESLIPHLLEETHEVVDAIRNGDDLELES